MSEEELKKLMKALDNNNEPLPKDVKWTMHMADKNGDGSIQTGILAITNNNTN